MTQKLGPSVNDGSHICFLTHSIHADWFVPLYHYYSTESYPQQSRQSMIAVSGMTGDAVETADDAAKLQHCIFHYPIGIQCQISSRAYSDSRAPSRGLSFKHRAVAVLLRNFWRWKMRETDFTVTPGVAIISDKIGKYSVSLHQIPY